jgi:glycosyltransferase involved in cell wall biosynthesis
VTSTPGPARYQDRGLVSLIMPVWRPRREWLLEAVESALAQRGCAVELIVVDDGCPEPVADLLAEVADERLRIVRVEHGGTSHARNAGFTAARGDWIRFVDCDDVLELDSTAHLLGIANGGSLIAYGATVWCDDELRPGSKMVSDLQGIVVRECLLARFQVTLPTLLFPRWVVDRVGEWDTEIVVCQDWDFLLRTFEHAPVRGDHRTALFYRRHEDAASAGALGSPESIRLGEEGMRSVIQRYFERHPDQRGTRLDRKAHASVELVMARTHREAYLAYLGHALRGDPAGTARELAVLVRIVGYKVRVRLLRALARRARSARPEGR